MKELLQKMGLSPNEIKVYLAVLKQQRVTPAEVAKSTKINRPTVYSIAKKLASRGLLVEDLGGKTLYLAPAQPQEILQLVRKEEEEFRTKASLLENLSDELTNMVASNDYPVPKIRFIEESGLEDFLYARSQVWNASMLEHDGVWWGFQDQDLIEQYQEWIAWYWKTSPKEVQLKLLTNPSEIEKKLAGKYPRREVRPWKAAQELTAGTWVIGDYVVMVVTSRKPAYLVEIHDRTMAHNYRELFKNLWELV